jgi:hypothetical protein
MKTLNVHLSEVKIRVEFSCAFLIMHPAMKMCKGVELWIHVFLTLAADGGERSASQPGCFISGEKAFSTDWIGHWVDLSTSLDAT